MCVWCVCGGGGGVWWDVCVVCICCVCVCGMCGVRGVGVVCVCECVVDRGVEEKLGSSLLK